jgi:dTDP-glucose 4,6-dehydratase
MNLLVTGGLGFIASNFIRHILKKDHEAKITNVDNVSLGANPTNLKEIDKDRRYQFIKGDITNSKLISRLVKNADVIVNAAAETHVDRSIANPQLFLRSNTTGAFTVLESIRKSNPDAKMIQVSTDETYGDLLAGSFTEDHRLKPSNPYAASKAAADLFTLAYCRTYGLNVAITRCTNNFGPYQSPEKLIPKTIIRADLNLRIPVYGTGKQVRDWLYVIDHCEGLSQIIDEGKAGEIYNISAGNEMPNLQLVGSVLDAMNKPKELIQLVEDRPGHDIRYSLDSTKIRSELGWYPRHSFSNALKDTVEWYLQNRKWWKPRATKRLIHPTPWKLRW